MRRPGTTEQVSLTVGSITNFDEASVNISKSLAGVQLSSGKTDIPFQVGRKSSHHWMSLLASAFRLMWWCSLPAVVLRSISLLKNNLPEHTTFAAKDSLPIRERSSLFVHFFLPIHWVSECRSEYLSSGSLMTWSSESSSIPK